MIAGKRICFARQLPKAPLVLPHQGKLLWGSLLHFTLGTAFPACALIRHQLAPDLSYLIVSVPHVERQQDSAYQLQGEADCCGMCSKSHSDATSCKITKSCHSLSWDRNSSCEEAGKIPLSLKFLEHLTADQRKATAGSTLACPGWLMESEGAVHPTQTFSLFLHSTPAAVQTIKNKQKTQL